MATYPWNAFTDRGSVGGTVLNSLADGTLSAATSVVDNATNKDTHMVIVITLGSLLPVAPAILELYMVKAPDGTLYEEAPVAGGLDRNTLIAEIPVPAGTAAKRVATGILFIPPFKVKFYVTNQLNVAMAASGNIIDVYTGKLASAA